MEIPKEYQELWSQLPKDIQANLKFAQLVREEDWSSVKPSERFNLNYFLGDYSMKIVKEIATKIYPNEDITERTPKMFSDYFFFVTQPILINGRKGWKQLTLYNGCNDTKLSSWLKNNTKRWFIKKKIQEEKRSKASQSLLEFVDYNTLINKDVENEEMTEYEKDCRRRVQTAFNALSKQDQDFINVMVINDEHWSDAFEELREYINAKGGKQAMLNWENKQKQKALWHLKDKAIFHLIIEFNKTK